MAVAAAAFVTLESVASAAQPAVYETVPADGQVVPPDVVFWVLGLPDRRAELTLDLVDEAGVAVPLSYPQRWNEARSARPLAPLADGGRYTLRITEPDGSHGEVGVTVGEVDPPSPEPPTVVLDVHHQCGRRLRVDATARVETAAPVSGVVSFDFGRGAYWADLVGAADASTFEGAWSNDGLQDVCVTTRLQDLSGEEVWSTFTCEPEHHCPTWGEPEEVTWTIEPDCGGEPGAWIRALVDLPPVGGYARGRLELEATTDLGLSAVVAAQDLRGEDVDEVTMVVGVLAAREVCFELVFYGVEGDEAWRVGPFCNEEPLTCAAEARDPIAPEPSGCGCASGTPRPPGWLAALLLLRRRGRGS